MATEELITKKKLDGLVLVCDGFLVFKKVALKVESSNKSCDDTPDESSDESFDERSDSSDESSDEIKTANELNLRKKSVENEFFLRKKLNPMELHTKTFKGVQQFDFKKMKYFQLILGEYGDESFGDEDEFVVSLVYGFELSVEHIDNGKIIKKFEEIFETSIKGLKYEKLEKKDCGWVKTICNQEIHTFGIKYFGLAKEYLRGLGGSSGLKCLKLVIHQLGQDCGIKTLEKNIELFDLKHCEELIVHIALDYSAYGRTILWNPEKLKAISAPKGLSKLNRNMLYGVGLLDGVANCYFDITYTTPRAGCKVKVIESKFYSELFKYGHKTGNWQEPEISIALLSPNEFSPGFCGTRSLPWERYIKNLKQLEYNWEHRDGNEKGHYARFETIFQLENPKKMAEARNEIYRSDTDAKSIYRIVKMALRNSKYWGFKIKKVEAAAVILKTEDVINHLRKNYCPSVNFLKKQVKERKKAVETKAPKKFDVGMYDC
jgi:hypothetical protein